jgi:Uma2 family endonuclease
MTLDEQIAQMTNQQEFVRLCNAIFSAEFGMNYQPIDGTRRDVPVGRWFVPVPEGLYQGSADQMGMSWG